MASSGRGSLRPYQPSRTPNFMFFGLLIAFIVMGYNYWSAAVAKNDLADRIASCRSQFVVMKVLVVIFNWALACTTRASAPFVLTVREQENARYQSMDSPATNSNITGQPSSHDAYDSTADHTASRWCWAIRSGILKLVQLDCLGSEVKT